MKTADARILHLIGNAQLSFLGHVAIFIVSLNHGTSKERFNHCSRADYSLLALLRSLLLLRSFPDPVKAAKDPSDIA